MLSELCQHHACGDIRAVDRGLGRAGALMGLLGRKQRARVVFPAGCIARDEDPEHFGTHPGIRKEPDPVPDCLPDELAGADGIDAAENHVADLHAAAKAFRDPLDL